MMQWCIYLNTIHNINTHTTHIYICINSEFCVCTKFYKMQIALLCRSIHKTVTRAGALWIWLALCTYITYRVQSVDSGKVLHHTLHTIRMYNDWNAFWVPWYIYISIRNRGTSEGTKKKQQQLTQNFKPQPPSFQSKSSHVLALGLCI